LEESDADRIRIAIVGAGYTGVEVACKLADRLKDRGRIRLIEQSDQILRYSPGFNREAATKSLQAHRIWLDLETDVEAITADAIAISYKGTTDTIPVDIVLWTVGNRVSEIVYGLPLKKGDSTKQIPHGSRGRLIVTPTLQVVDYPDVFALGDLADSKDVNGQKVPTTAQVAIQQADYVAWNLWASLTGRPPLPFRYQYFGEMLTLGMDQAAVTALGFKLDGPLGAVARRLAYLYRMPTLDHQIRVGLNWITQPLVSVLEGLAHASRG
jgi:NADH dehydrogenase